MAVRVNYDVVRLQVPENNVSLMKSFDCQEHLAEVLPGPLLGEASLTLEHSAQIPARAEIENQEQLRLRLEGVVEPDDERMLRV